MIATDDAPSFESIEGMHRDLVRLARASGVLRLELGRGFEALAVQGGHHEMGFSSLEAYALERCERSARWVQQARAVARRLSTLPKIREALRFGRVTWSMASLIAKEATASDEEWWLAEANHRTVRQMQQLVRARRDQSDVEVKASGNTPTRTQSSEPEDVCTLTITVNQEDAWLFESARMVVERLGGCTMEEVVYALTAEGCTTLMPKLPADVSSNWIEGDDAAAQRAWEAELRRWREEAEIRCENRIPRQSPDDAEDMSEVGAFDGGPGHIDEQIRKLAAELTTREVAIGEFAERFWTADGWRRLGFATESQYAREGLGMSLSSVEAKRRLSRATHRLSEVKTAIENRAVGYEGARLVASVANPETVRAWLERAAERTVKHLREEVDAAQMLARLAGGGALRPPSEEVMEEVEHVRSQIASGRIFRDAAAESQMSAPPDAMTTTADKSQMSALRGLAHELLAHARMFSRRGRDRRGRVALRLRITAETRRFYRWLEQAFHRYGDARVPFLRFLCRTLIETWKHALGSDVAYAEIYARDGYRCKSPVCTHKDLTPHHLRFRSAGGDDNDENLVGLCVWCHLEGIHGGRLAATPPASCIQWEIGRSPHTRVEGRRRTPA